MRKIIFPWLNREFILLSGEAQGSGTVEQQTDELFERFDAELRISQLSLEDTVRTRIFAADKEARELATSTRAKILTGKRKAASSSYYNQPLRLPFASSAGFIRHETGAAGRRKRSGRV